MPNNSGGAMLGQNQSNIDSVIELVRASKNPAQAKAGLMATAWEPGPVVAMLERAGPQATRPEGLDELFGLKEDGYRLSETQAQAILELRLHRLTGLEQDKIRDEYGEVLKELGR